MGCRLGGVGCGRGPSFCFLYSASFQENDVDLYIDQHGIPLASSNGFRDSLLLLKTTKSGSNKQGEPRLVHIGKGIRKCGNRIQEVDRQEALP